MSQQAVSGVTSDVNYWGALKLIPKTVWCLGIATFLMNASTIIIFSFSPLFLTTVLGLNMFGIGLIEATVECLSWLVRIISGILSDFFRKRKIFILISYSLGALARPIFPLTTSVGWIFFGRMLDRIANGLQATPREALIADLAPPGLKGACFGLRQALGTAGSAIGALVGVIVMKLTNENFQAVFWVATFPAILAVALLVFMIEDPRFSQERALEYVPPSSKKKEGPIQWACIKEFPPSFWLVVVVTMFFLFGRFSGVFLIMWAEKCGLEVAYAPLVMVAFNIFSTLSAYPVGALSDRLDRRLALWLGFILIITADIILAFANSTLMVIIGVIFWGLQFGITQSIPMAMVADRAPAHLRGTAFGIFYLGNGLALFVANTLAGYISKTYGQSYAFMISGCMIVFATICSWFIGKETHSKQ